MADAEREAPSLAKEVDQLEFKLRLNGPYDRADANYSFVFTDSTLMVGPAPLTLTAAPSARVYGAPDPTFLWTVSGFVNTDATQVIVGSPSLSTSATLTSAPNPYPITAALGTLGTLPDNYTRLRSSMARSRSGRQPRRPR
jgi:MBG domain (YGX type)